MLKGIILAGGNGTRLLPLTKNTNKHLLPVGGKPMIEHAVTKLTGAGITDIMVVTGVDHAGDVFSLLGSGHRYGCQFTYKVQDEAGGIAQALSLCEQFVNGGLCCVILGDNIFTAPLNHYASDFVTGAKILIKSVPDPSRFGVAVLCDKQQVWPPQTYVCRIDEKPTEPLSNYAVTGIYLYDSDVFDVIRTLKPSGRGELEITDVNNWYLARNTLQHQILDGEWSDAGTHESLAQANIVAESKEYRCV